MKTNCSRFSFVVLSFALAAAPFVSGCISGVCGVDADPELEAGDNASANEAPGHEHADPCGEVTQGDNSLDQHPKDCHCPSCNSPPVVD
jgi:hypothetical protein